MYVTVGFNELKTILASDRCILHKIEQACEGAKAEVDRWGFLAFGLSNAIFDIMECLALNGYQDDEIFKTIGITVDLNKTLEWREIKHNLLNDIKTCGSYVCDDAGNRDEAANEEYYQEIDSATNFEELMKIMRENENQSIVINLFRAIFPSSVVSIPNVTQGMETIENWVNAYSMCYGDEPIHETIPTPDWYIKNSQELVTIGVYCWLLVRYGYITEKMMCGFSV